MNNFLAFFRETAMTALVSLAVSVPALAATFVYVSNAEDGEIAAGDQVADMQHDACLLRQLPAVPQSLPLAWQSRPKAHRIDSRQIGLSGPDPPRLAQLGP